MSSIQEKVSNYTHICDQIKRKYAELAELRDRKKALEAEVEEILGRMNAPGLIVEGSAVFLEQRQHRERMGHKKKQAEIARILAAHSVANPDALATALANLGAVKNTTVLKIKKSQ